MQSTSKSTVMRAAMLTTPIAIALVSHHHPNCSIWSLRNALGTTTTLALDIGSMVLFFSCWCTVEYLSTLSDIDVTLDTDRAVG
jgi:kynureninase